MKNSVWHYIKVFCAFFSLIATVAAVLVLTEVRTNYGGYLAVLWLLGVISAILVAPGKFFKFGVTIMGACATFGWFLLPFPLDLVTVVASVAVGLMAVLAALFCIPAIFTIYTYITDIRYDCVDWKKDLMAAAAGIGAVLVTVGLFFAAQGITKAVEAPIMDNRFDPVSCYTHYMDTHPDAVQCPEEVLLAPVSTQEDEDGYVRHNRYQYDSREQGMYFANQLQVAYEYTNGAWRVTEAQCSRELTGFDPISGSWTGTGDYWGNLSPNNQYTFVLENMTQSGGTGSMRIYLEDVIDESKTFTVETVDVRLEGDTVMAELIMRLDTPLVYDVFGSEDQIDQLECTLCLSDSTMTTTAFSFGQMLLQPA